jgi:hypothetical protein
MKCSCPTKFDDHSRAVVRASLDQSCPIHGARTQALPHCSTCTCGVGSQIVQTPAGLSQEHIGNELRYLLPNADDPELVRRVCNAILRRLGGQT